MSNIGKNIKKIRTVKKLSQAAFAELFNLARPSVGAYEEGRAEPKIDTIIQIAHYFGLSIDLLLNKELTINDLYKFDLLPEGTTKKEIQKEEVFTTIDRSTGIALVLEDAYLEYLVNYSNKDFIDKLQKIHLPVDKEHQNSRAFQLNGSEMEYNHNGLHHGDILLCNKLDKISSRRINVGKVYVLVTAQSITTRRAISTGKSFVFKADDPNYDNIELVAGDLLEMWEVYGVYSTYLNPPSALEERVMQLENAVEAIQSKIK